MAGPRPTVYVSHPNSIPFRDRLYGPLRCGALEQVCTFVLPHETHDDPAAFPTADIIASDVDLLVVEASAASTGSGIEIGWADAAGVPIVVVHHPLVRVSRSVRAVAREVVTYTDARELIDAVAGLVERHARQ